MDDRFRGLMLDALRLTHAGDLHAATRAIQRALGGPPSRDFHASDTHVVLDGLVTEIDPAASPAAARAPHIDVPGGSDHGGFIAGSHTHGAMSRDYSLFVPPGATGRVAPLVVMLHGCTQDPGDFAAGTGMNERAAAQGFFVLYPEQSQRANPQRCWNWFKHTHQRRHRGEPALIASMTQAVARRHGIDARRVYVAGLSAGGAMAALVAACHPELYAALGVHSGLAPGAAANLPEAFAVMRGGVGAPTTIGSDAPAGIGRIDDHSPAERRTALQVPTIVFHGDRDPTVHPRNGEQVIEAAIGDAARIARMRVEHGTSVHGRRWTRRIHTGDAGGPDVEHWLVHGAGHAWSGGSSAGTYTDPTGPDATGEMLRFFLEHRLGTPTAT